MGTSVFDSELLQDAWSTEEMRGVFNLYSRRQGQLKSSLTWAANRIIFCCTDNV